MRKMMRKEVTKTTVKVATVKSVNGKPEMQPLPDEIFLGNVSLEKAQKEVNKKYDEPVTVFEVKTDTKVYEMAVEEFVKVASVKEEDGKKDQVTSNLKQK